MDQLNITSTFINSYDKFNNFIKSPLGLAISLFIVVLSLIILISLGGNSQVSNINQTSNISDKSIWSTLFTIVFIILIIYILLKIYEYFISQNAPNYLKRKIKKIDEKISEEVHEGEYKPSATPEIKFKKQVFNIPGNYYNYEDAKAICKAYGSELATYKQLEQAYNNKAEWCNYGWSADQMALFPTQQSTFDHLQTIKGHEHDCGRPGVNGGYMPDANLKFGVNCYGYKPRMTEEEEELMKTMPRYPKTQEEIDFENKVSKIKNELNKITISPFNYNLWSEL